MLQLSILLSLIVTFISASNAKVDTRRHIGQPVKTRRVDQNPRFLRKLTVISEPGYSLSCHVCLHYSEHFVTALHVNEEHDKTKTTSGWRMDERKVIGYRGRDSMMDDMMDNICRQFTPHSGYSECDRKGVCEQVPVSKSLKAKIKRTCTEFFEVFEDEVVKTSRTVDDDDKIAETVCTSIHACTGMEKIKHADVLKSPDL